MYVTKPALLVLSMRVLLITAVCLLRSVAMHFHFATLCMCALQCIQGLKSEYNSLASVYATSQESGRLLAEACVDPESRRGVEEQVSRLHDDWERLGQLFMDQLQKLTDALVQVSVCCCFFVCFLFMFLFVVSLASTFPLL